MMEEKVQFIRICSTAPNALCTRIPDKRVFIFASQVGYQRRERAFAAFFLLFFHIIGMPIVNGHQSQGDM